ncbi:MAG: ATP-dependent DNA helicase RecG [Lachnospiraceae bacterium]|nr:ATP-dependent DNA helicase RecG [Lachnospiraceae bacterium]
MNFDTPIREIKGIGEKTEKLMNKIGVYTAGDILLHYPREYRKFDSPVSISKAQLNTKVAVYATIATRPLLRRTARINIVIAQAKDETGRLELVWFRSEYIVNSLKPGEHYVFCGSIVKKNGKLQMDQPEVYTADEYKRKMASYQPVYAKTAGLTNNAIQKTVKTCLDSVDIQGDYLPEDIRERECLAEYNFALEQMHFPENTEKLIEARKRLVFDEFFMFILRMQIEKGEASRRKNPFGIKDDGFIDDMVKKLPYELTGAQHKCLKELKGDMASEYVMQRLIQGDVGSGKTIIAFLCMAWMSHLGYQSALMAPTEVLARQHKESFEDLKKILSIDFPVILLTGSMTAKEKRLAYEAMETEKNAMIIGTQALIQDKAGFSNLALVITDEQHRFGVKQRETLSLKGFNPHIAVMSATPIPRTLAIILYGDLDISVIDEVPAKRLPIKNCVVDESYRNTANNFVVKEVRNGHQVYVICPLVEESEGMEGKNVKDHSKELQKNLPSDIKVGMLHGKMKPKEKNAVMEAFARNDIQVLVSTTVVEVGVNVPNATVMVIENADRFGLAQLHQLRGRVGRGDAQSYCIMMNASDSKTAKKRLDILNRSNDGFAIASEDLKLRGPGDFFGIRQSGDFVFDIADIYQDADILKAASNEVTDLLKKDPSLKEESQRKLKYYLTHGYEKKYDNLNL